LRAEYIVFQAHPCKYHEYLQGETSRLLTSQQNLTSLAMKLKAIAAMALQKQVDSSRLIEEFGRVAKDIGTFAPAEAAAMALKSTEQQTKEFIAHPAGGGE